MTLNGMVSRVQALCGRHSLATSDLVTSFINSRHNDLLESHDWSRKKQEINLTAVPDKNNGTVDMSEGSATVVGHGTAFTASDVGKHFRAGSDQYAVFTVQSVTHSALLSLGDLKGNVVAYPGTSIAGTNYLLFKRLYSLGVGIGSILTVKHQTRLTETSEEYLDSIDPGRTATASTPTLFARAPWDQSTVNDIVRIELYPRPLSPAIVTVEVKKSHVDLFPSQNPIVPSAPLEWFASVDTCYALFARTKEPKWLALADKYNTEGEKSLEFEKNEDYKKFGRIGKVRDVQGGVSLGATDFGIDHDTGSFFS